MLKWLEKNLPKIVMAPAVGLIGWFVYGFVLWTLYISFTNSKILPKYDYGVLVSMLNYGHLVSG